MINTMKILKQFLGHPIGKLCSALISSVLIYKAGYRNIDAVKSAASATWSAAGYRIVGYEGYQWDSLGGAVWYEVKRLEDDSTVYSGFIAKWGSEYHIYSIHALNAFRPTR